MQYFLFESNDNILPFGGEVFYYPSFFAVEESDLLFTRLRNEINWQQQPIKIFGREVMQPRLTAWYGDEGKAYSYSGITMQPYQWTESLLQIKSRIETCTNAHFNSALLNLYRNGKDSMGWHRDNEKELGINPVIGSVSFGAARKFSLRYYKDKSVVRSFDLTHGSLLLMKGQTQHHWEHQLAKVNKAVAERINITFRYIL